MAGGRPTDYSEAAFAIAKAMYKMGATDKQVAEELDVTVQTIHNWASVHPEFFEARKSWKEFADEIVEQSLFARATGYSHPDVDIKAYEGAIIQTDIVKHYPPDPVSMIFWLKNRRRQDWRDRVDMNHSGTVGQLSDEQVEERYRELQAKLAGKADPEK